jgi:acyl-CoA synthetase (AMP-forming)/AMP-acid ligase II/acyl carrier protein
MDPSATLLSLFASAAWIRAFEVLPGSDGRWTVRCVVEADRSVDDLRGLLNERAANLAEQVDVRIVTSLSTTPDAAMSDAPAPSPALAHCPAVALPGLAELPQTLPDALRRAAQNDSAQSLVHVRADGSEKWQNFGDLLGEASAVCGGLAKLGLKPGDSALLLLDRSADVLPAFWGCLLGGIRPAIAQIPPTFTGENRGLEQLCKVWRLLDGPLLITKSNLLEPVRSLAGRLDVESVRTTDIASLLTSAPANDTFAARPEDTAFFSLTSGSTGVPKCIMLTHANIIQRAHGANLLCGHTAEDVVLNWLPFDHIGSISDWHLRCVLLGCRMVYAEKESVIARPLHWLDLIDKYRVTHTWAPNFAYSLVTSSLTTRPGNSPAPTWDLSCVDGMLTAGESVSQTVTEPFLKELAPYGLPATAIRPAFGMAETGSGITYQVVRHDRPLKFLSVQRSGAPAPSAGSSKSEVESAGTFASLGPPIPGVGLRIVDDEQQVVPEATIGHLQVCGTAVTPGYFHNPEANRVFHADGWFETGDLGLLADGELVITGRAKESIIVRGVNYACSELEETVGGVPGVEPSFTAACAVRRPGSDREELAVFFHTATDEETPLSELLREIQQRLVRQTGVRPDFLLPVAKEAIPKTAIGKIQRMELARRFAAGEFAAVLAAVGRLQRQPDDARAAHAQPQLPQNEIEKQLAEIWKEALSLEQIDVRDNLFDLGGDSLLLTRMHVKLQDRFGPQISLVEMFNYPTIESL